MPKRIVVLGTVYLLAALVGHALERSGNVRCECSEECWCHRSPLALFRWVAPFGHR